jgi:ribonuclease HI
MANTSRYIRTDRRWEYKVGYAIVKEEHTIKKRILPQNTEFSAEQCAIIGAIQSQKNSRHKIVIITDPPSTIMAAESRTPTKNPKTQTIRKMLDQEGPKITLQWVPSHKGIPGNEKAAKDEEISTTKRYPPHDLKKWLTEEDFRKRDQRWKKRKQQDERNETGHRQKEGYKRNAKE